MSIFDGESIYDESPAMRELRAKLAMDHEAELAEDEIDEDDVDYQQLRIDELLRQRYNLRADLNTCVLDNESLRAENRELHDKRDELHEQLEYEKSENGWAREFLNRIGPKCGKPDCRSLVDYVAQLEAEAKRTDDGWIRLPVDADGEPIHIGDNLESDEHAGKRFPCRGLSVEVSDSGLRWTVCISYDSYSGTSEYTSASRCHHVKERTVEDVLFDFVADCFETESLNMNNLDKYAAEIRDLMGGDAR